MTFESWAGDEIAQMGWESSLKRPSPNQSMFKYIGLNTETSWKHLERTLNTFELIGATQHSLNDPFEMSPKIFDDLNPTTIERFLPRKLRAGFDRPEPLNETDVTPLREKAQAYFDRVCRYGRIVAFCERSDSPLLWSHYAHSYEGACLHFIGRGFSRLHTKIGYVAYSSHRPTYPLSLALSLASSGSDSLKSSNLAESERLIFFTKAADWAYETEVRAIYNSNSMSAVRYESDGLLSIIVGQRMPAENRQRLSALIEQSPIPKLRIREARLSNNSFSVEID